MPSQQRKLGTLGNKFPKRLIEKRDGQSWNEISKLELETNPEFGKRTPKYWNDSHKKMDDEIYRGSDIKTKFCKNHIRVVSKEDTGRDLL